MVGVVIMPEELLAKLKKNILPQWKSCFLAAIIIGLIAHAYKITNWLPNWDSLVFRYDEQNMLSLGRWFLPVASAPSSFYDLPWLAGFISILLHALGAVVICRIFNVKKNLTAILIGGAVASFPTVTSVLLYNYVADAYALSFLFACLSAFLLTKEKPKYIAATILLALSVGIYQAYVTVTVMLLLCYLVLEALKKEVTAKELLIKCGKFLLTGIAGMAVYYLVLTVALKLTNTELLDYQGLSDATSLAGLDILGSLYVIKESFVNYFFDFSAGISLFNVLNLLFLSATVVLYLLEIIKNKLPLGKILLVLLFALLLPFGASILAFINSSIDYHNLMKMGFFVFYLFFILLFEKFEAGKNKASLIKPWLVLILTSLLIFNQIVIANVSYHKINIAYEKSYGVLIRIADRIEQTEGSENCSKLLVVGSLENSEGYSSLVHLDMTGTTDGFILRADDEIVGQSVLCSALNDYCETNYTFLAGDEKAEVLSKIDESSLGIWPAKNSVLVFEDVIIVKLGD